MRYLKYLALVGIFLFAAGYSQAQVSVGIGVGPVYGGYVAAPVCPYGYYDYYPYDCAPYGYWGPTYFVGGEFIGVGPWFHGDFDRDRYWGDRDRFEHGRGFAGDRGRGNFRSFGRSDNHFDRGNRGGNDFRGRGGDNHFDRGNGNRGGNFQSFGHGNGNRGGDRQSFSRGNGNRGGVQSFSRGNSGRGNSSRGGSGRGSSGGSFRGGNSRGGGGSRGGSHGGGSHGGGHGR